MMRFIVSVLATVAIFFAATAASALITLTVVGTNLTTASTDLTQAVASDVIQLDIFMTNDQAFGIQGAAFQAYGFGAALTYQNGSSASSWFNKKITGSGVPSKGMNNQAGTTNGTDGSSIAIPRTLSNTNFAQVVLGDGSIQFYNGITTVSGGVVGDGSNDYGIQDGGTGGLLGGQNTPNTGYTGNGAAHARLIFHMNGVTGVGLGIGGANGSGTNADTGDLFTSADVNDAFIQIGTIPEPGTALLMGLGLSGLSMAGRRRS